MTLEINTYTSMGRKLKATGSGAESSLATNRYRYNGKEEQALPAGLPYTDYGARFFDPDAYTWLTPDPLSSKYPGINPYNFCAGNPVNMVDEDGNVPVGAIVKSLKAVKKAYKASKTAQRITAGALLVNELYGYYDDANTLLSPEASSTEKALAVFDLATGFGSEAKTLAKNWGINGLLETNIRAFTYRNFRSNLGKISGGIREGMDAHHTIPKAVEGQLKDMNIRINIHDPKYGYWMERNLHRSTWKQYNQEWETYLKKCKTEGITPLCNKSKKRPRN